MNLSDIKKDLEHHNKDTDEKKDNINNNLETNNDLNNTNISNTRFSYIHRFNDNMPFRKDNTNKRILCFNIITSKKCIHGDECKFAHSLNEQSKDKYNSIVLNVINKVKDAKNRNILEGNIGINKNILADSKLYKYFLKYTSICNKCIINKCVGGYNCKYGIFDKSNLLCFYDLEFGNCNPKYCNFLHITNYNIHEKNYFKTSKEILKFPKPYIINDNKENKNDYDISGTRKLSIISTNNNKIIECGTLGTFINNR